MNPRRVGAAGLVALGALALLAVVAANPFSTRASTTDVQDAQQTPERLSADVNTPSQVGQPDQLGQLQATEEDAETTKP